MVSTWWPCVQCVQCRYVQAVQYTPLRAPPRPAVGVHPWARAHRTRSDTILIYIERYLRDTLMRDIWWRGDQWSVCQSWGVVKTSDSASRIHRLCERYGYRKYENFTIEEQLINTSTTQTANLVNVGIREQPKRPSSIVCELNKGSFCCPLWGEWQIPLGFCSAARHIYLSVRTSAKL